MSSVKRSVFAFSVRGLSTRHKYEFKCWLGLEVLGFGMWYVQLLVCGEGGRGGGGGCGCSALLPSLVV